MTPERLQQIKQLYQAALERDASQREAFLNEAWGLHRKLGLGFWTAPVAGGSPLKSDLAPQVEQRIKEAGVSFGNFLWAPSGRVLYLEGTARGVRNLWRVEVDPDTLRWVEGPERLTTGPGLDTSIALSTDGKKLAFTARSERTRVWSLPFNAAIGRVKGAGQPVTAAGADAWMSDLSRDGRKLVFVNNRAEKQELWEKSLADSRETLLAAASEFLFISPRWSVDGLRIAYRRDRPTNPERTEFVRSIVLLPAGGGEEQVLTSLCKLSETPWDWSADGNWILGSSRRNTGQAQICLFPIAAAPGAEVQMRVIASHPEYNLWQPHFSPDERWISFNAIKATDARISTVYVVPPSGGEWTRITEGKYWDDKPRWSPDGKIIYFVSNRTGFFNVWGIRFDPKLGAPVGEAFRVTMFESPGQMVSPNVSPMETAVTVDRLVLPITEVSGNIWILEKVDR